MIIFLVYFSKSLNTDEFGVEYSDDYTDLRKTRETIPSQYVVRAACTTILGGDTNLKSAFANCLTKLKNISFEIGSQIKYIYPWVFSSSSLEYIDFSNCFLLLDLNYSIFAQCNNLKNVTLPPNLQYIRAGCFYNCASLKYIKLPDSLLEIDDYIKGYDHVFQGSLNQIDISPDCKLQKIGADAFMGTRLTYFFIPKDVNQIVSSAFSGVAISNFEIDPRNGNFKTDGLIIYQGNSNSTLKIVSRTYNWDFVVPDFVTYIAPHAFRGVPIPSITIHDNIWKIDVRSLSSTMIQEFKYNGIMTLIMSACFASCSRLEKVYLTEKITEIHESAFSGCPLLNLIVLPDSLTTIGKNAFASCVSLTNISIPPKVNSIGAGVFLNCNSSLVVDTDRNEYCSIDDQILIVDNKQNMVDYFGSDATKDLHVPSNCNKISASTFKSKEFRSLIFDGNPSLVVESSVFESSKIKTIEFPIGLRTLGENCFLNCNLLQSVKFHADCTISIIPLNCFKNCINLEIIILPQSITKIANYAFLSCTKISNNGLENTKLQSLGNQYFAKSGLKTANLPSTVNFIDISAFESSLLTTFSTSTATIAVKCCYSCQNLETLIINNGVEVIEESAFQNCDIKELTLPASITTLSENSFADNENFATLKLEQNSNLTEVRGGCFLGCPLLKRIQLFEGKNKFLFDNGALLSIDQTILYTFLPSSDIRTFVVPVKTQKILSRSFYFCRKLNRILFNGNYISVIGFEAFKGCTNLNFVFVSSPSITQIDKDAFADCPELKKCGSFSIPKESFQIFKSRGVTDLSLREDCKNECNSVPIRNTGHISLSNIAVLIVLTLG